MKRLLLAILLSGSFAGNAFAQALPATITKSFSPSTVVLNGNSVATITVTNPNAFSITNVQFSDTMPAGINLITQTGGDCSTPTTGGGMFTINPGTEFFSSTSAVLTAGQSCTIIVSVQGIAVGVHVNTTSQVTATGAPAGTPGSGTLTVTAAPVAATITKAFSPSTVVLNGNSVATITVTNPNAFPISNVQFSDTMPPGIDLITQTGGTCSTPATGGGMFTINPGTETFSSTSTVLTAGQSCTITVSVNGIAVGAHVNTTSQVTATATPAGTAASGTLTVTAAPVAATITKAFSPSSVVLNGTSVATITVTNPNAFSITNVVFSDTMPAGIDLITQTGGTCSTLATGGGMFTINPGTETFSSTSSVLTAGQSCTITVSVNGIAVGAHVNTTSQVTSSSTPAGTAASATLTVTAAPLAATIALAFSPSTVVLNGTSVATVTVTNPNTFSITNVQFSDTMPAGIDLIAQTGGTCSTAATGGGPFAIDPAARTFSSTSSVLTAGQSCTISVSVRGVAIGGQVNTTSQVTSAEAPAGTAASATLTVAPAVPALPLPMLLALAAALVGMALLKLRGGGFQSTA